MTITTAQNVGIGTTNPVNPFQTTLVSGAGAPYIGINQTGDNPYIEYQRYTGVSSNYAAARIKSYGDSALAFETSTQAAIGSQTFTERGRFDASSNFLFNSGYGSVAVAYGCRAWVRFNGSGTPSIFASGNVSSLTDFGTGIFGVNFTNAMPDANYSWVGAVRWNESGIAVGLVSTDAGGARSTTQVAIYTSDSRQGNKYDATDINVAVFR